MKSNDQTIYLFLPSFFHLPAAARRQLHKDGLPLIMGRGESLVGVATGDWQEALWQLQGLPASLGEDLPVGALRLLGAGQALDQGLYACIDPVHVSPNRDHLLLMGNETVSISADEAQALVAELNAFFAEDGLQIQALTPKQWVWRSTALPALHCCPLHQASGRNVRECLPQGEKVPAWTRLLTEAQMLLHSSPVNARRRAQGQAEINSLWLWGMGRKPETRAGRFVRLYGDDLFVAGLAQCSGAVAQALPASAEMVLRGEGPALLVLDFDPQQPLDEQLARLDQDWLLPLLQGLRSGRFARLTLELGSGIAVTATAAELKRFWKRRRRLEALEH